MEFINLDVWSSYTEVDLRANRIAICLSEGNPQCRLNFVPNKRRKKEVALLQSADLQSVLRLLPNVRVTTNGIRLGPEDSESSARLFSSDTIKIFRKDGRSFAEFLCKFYRGTGAHLRRASDGEQPTLLKPTFQ